MRIRTASVDGLFPLTTTSVQQGRRGKSKEASTSFHVCDQVSRYPAFSVQSGLVHTPKSKSFIADAGSTGGNIDGGHNGHGDEGID